MKAIENEVDKSTFWQMVFSQSKANGAPYKGDDLPGINWEWPKDTYFQRRLQKLRWHPTSGKTEIN